MTSPQVLNAKPPSWLESVKKGKQPREIPASSNSSWPAWLCSATQDNAQVVETNSSIDSIGKPAWLLNFEEDRKPPAIPTPPKFDIVPLEVKPSTPRLQVASSYMIRSSGLRSTKSSNTRRGEFDVPVLSGFNPYFKKLPHVSTNKSKNDMSAPSRELLEDCPENIFDNEYATAMAMEGAVTWLKDWEDLINLRRTCTLYASVGVVELKKHFVYRITKRFALYFWKTFEDYLPEEIPATLFRLDPRWMIYSPINIHAPDSKSTATADIMQNILQKIGHNLDYLRMDDFEVGGGLTTLRNVLFTYGPKMRQLIFNRPTFLRHTLKQDILDNGGPFYNPVSESYVPKLAEVPLTLPTFLEPRRFLAVFHYRAIPGSWFPLHWLEVFFGFPNLQDLKVADVCLVEMNEILTSLVSDKLPYPLPLKKFNAFYTWSRSLALEPHQDTMTQDLVPLYLQLKFPLTHLDICVKRAMDPLGIRNFIMNYSKTLEHLVLTRETRATKDNNFELIFSHAFLGSLRYVEATNDMIRSFHFLRAMPHLEKLVMNENDPSERLTIYAHIFSSKPNKEATDDTILTQFVAGYLDELHLSNVDFPVYRENAITFDLASIFPQLTCLRINDISDDHLRAIFSGLSNLRKLTIYGTDISITDRGIIGVDDLRKECLQRKVKRRQFPYVGNLKFLKSFIVDYHIPTQPLRVTKISLDYGLADCEFLNQIVLFGTRVKIEDSHGIMASLPICSFRIHGEWE